MQILHKPYHFSIPIKDLIIIYNRCYLEQSCILWHACMTEQQRTNLEWVQKVALRIILNDQYETYENELNLVELVNFRMQMKTTTSQVCVSISKKWR